MTKVYVGNLSQEVTEADLKEAFEPYGKVGSVQVNARRGVAFVELDTEAAYAAIDGLRGQQIMGRSVDVVLDQPSGGRRARRPGRRR